MLHGVVKSYGKLYLLNENHDGSFGRMLKNGDVYQGVTIIADTSAGTEGALTSDTINALRSIGINVDNVIDVSGTQHTTAGQDETPTSSDDGGNNDDNPFGDSKPVGGTKVTGGGSGATKDIPVY